MTGPSGYTSRPRHGFPRAGLRVAATSAVLAALAMLTARRGFVSPLADPGVLARIQLAAIAVYVLCGVAIGLTAERRWEWVRRRWFEAAMLVIVAGCAVEALVSRGEAAYRWVDLGTVGAIVVHGWAWANAASGNLAAIRPVRRLVIGFGILVAAGTIALALPAAASRPQYRYKTPRHAARHLQNCALTAISAATCTGLAVYDTQAEFTRFGQWVIMLLMQAGGLGMMVFAAVVMGLAGGEGPVSERVGRGVRFAVLTTVVLEAAGAAALYSAWPGHMSVADRCFHSVFAAVSAFGNGGFALASDSMTGMRKTWQLYAVLLPLVVLGGLGWPILQELTRLARGRAGLGFRSRLVLTTTALLIVVPAAAFMALEWPAPPKLVLEQPAAGPQSRPNDSAVIREMPRLLDRLGASVFLSASARTAGLSSFDTQPGSLSKGTVLLLMMLMIVGGSPAGTAGGVKTVTVAVLALAVVATLRGRREIRGFGEAIDPAVVRAAGTVLAVYAAIVAGVTLALCVTEKAPLAELAFEAASACGNVGLSLGITPGLSIAGETAVMLGMLAGRLTPLALAATFVLRDARHASGPDHARGWLSS